MTIMEQAKQAAEVIGGQVEFAGPTGAVIVAPNGHRIGLNGPTVPGWVHKNRDIITQLGRPDIIANLNKPLVG